jgi:hypothetical protein
MLLKFMFCIFKDTMNSHLTKNTENFNSSTVESVSQ